MQPAENESLPDYKTNYEREEDGQQLWSSYGSLWQCWLQYIYY